MASDLFLVSEQRLGHPVCFRLQLTLRRGEVRSPAPLAARAARAPGLEDAGGAGRDTDAAPRRRRVGQVPSAPPEQSIEGRKNSVLDGRTNYLKHHQNFKN